MFLERPETIQSPTAAKNFQLKYDDIIERNIPGSLMENFIADAKDAAAESILAASVTTHVDFELKEWVDNHSAAKKKAIRYAGKAAKAVVELDNFLNDDNNAREPVIYALQDNKTPYEKSDFLNVHFTVADGSYVNALTRDGRGEPFYHVMPQVKYGVQSPIVAHGEVIQNHLQGTQNYSTNSTEDLYRFMQSLGANYPDISHGTFWPKAYGLPTFTHGSDNVLELFSKVIDKDYSEGYTEHRNRRCGYLLLRQARFMGHAIADELYSIADDAGIIPVWQKQAADDCALDAVTTLKFLHSKGKTVADFSERYFRIFNSTSLELKSLKLQQSVIIERVKVHAAQRKLQITYSENKQIVDLLTDS